LWTLSAGAKRESAAFSPQLTAAYIIVAFVAGATWTYQSSSGIGLVMKPAWAKM
jgi:hypothetical protein